MLSDAFRRHRKAAGLPTGSLHILRHTAATLALTATPLVPLHVVAGRLGDDARTLLGTSRTYCRTQTRWPPKRSLRLSLTSR